MRLTIRRPAGTTAPPQPNPTIEEGGVPNPTCGQEEGGPAVSVGRRARAQLSGGRGEGRLCRPHPTYSWSRSGGGPPYQPNPRVKQRGGTPLYQPNAWVKEGGWSPLYQPNPMGKGLGGPAVSAEPDGQAGGGLPLYQSNPTATKGWVPPLLQPNPVPGKNARKRIPTPQGGGRVQGWESGY